MGKPNENLQTERTPPSSDDLKEIARQLANPEGKRGVDMGHMMNDSNIGMTRNTVQRLNMRDRDVVLELGHGNAHHLAELHEQTNVAYHGLDISATMKSEAEDYARRNNLSSKSFFQLYDGINIPFDDSTFDKIFTVNTIYFWQKPNHLLGELYRVLKADGRLCITYVDKATMDKLPFTAYGFTKYTSSTFEIFIRQSQFRIVAVQEYVEKIKNKMGEEMDRTYFVAVMAK